jgi:hypothetical protein
MRPEEDLPLIPWDVEKRQKLVDADTEMSQGMTTTMPTHKLGWCGQSQTTRASPRQNEQQQTMYKRATQIPRDMETRIDTLNSAAMKQPGGFSLHVR